MHDTDRGHALAERREALVRQAAQQRVALAGAAALLGSSFCRFERVLVLWRAVRQRPWLIAAPAALLMLWRPRAALRLLAAAPMLWRIGQSEPWLPRR